MKVEFKDKILVHQLPSEDRTNFEILDNMREKLRIGNMWLVMIKAIKRHTWRLQNPKIKRFKKTKIKKRLKDISRFDIKEDISL